MDDRRHMRSHDVCCLAAYYQDLMSSVKKQLKIMHKVDVVTKKYNILQ